MEPGQHRAAGAGCGPGVGARRAIGRFGQRRRLAEAHPRTPRWILRAESVLPTAVRIAGANEAELLLAFVVREPVATAVLRAPEDIDFARELASRLETSGKHYLDGLRTQLQREGASVRTVVVRSADERQSLLELCRTERSDLVVLSAHGSTCNPALTTGSITAHLLTHSGVPLLVLQDLRDSATSGPELDRRAPPRRSSYPESV